jgi:hypothetical protein
LNKKEKTTHIVDVGCPFDTRVKERERTKIENYTEQTLRYGTKGTERGSDQGIHTAKQCTK